MTIKPFVLFLVVLAVAQLAPMVRAQELDGSEVRRELREREERVNKLSTEDQLKLRAAQQKAAEDPEVKAALEKRNQVLEEYRAAVRAAIIKADPTVKSILERVAIPAKGP
jgi:hypothetical protein